MNLNTKSKQQNTYDAIVVGAGISGGWAAKERCEKGLQSLVLERGRGEDLGYLTLLWHFEMKSDKRRV